MDIGFLILYENKQNSIFKMVNQYKSGNKELLLKEKLYVHFI